MSGKFVVIHEARADFVTATELADRVLVEQIDWLDETLLDSQRRWVERTPKGERFAWKSIPRLAREAGIRVHGHFAGEPAHPDAHAARRAILYVQWALCRVDAILLIRDADNQIERRRGLEQARDAVLPECRVIIGLAVCKRESWALSGFDANNAGESKLLESERRGLGFDPCKCPQQLTAGAETALRSPKRVLDALTNGDRGRERECWTAVSLNTLRTRGGKNGLASYLAEVEASLAPLITGVQGRPQ